jgi:hypothetical protein
MNTAAIRWLVRGKTNPPLIQYMLINKELEYLIYPKELVVTDLKKNLNQIFEAIDGISNNTPLEICYKSIQMGYWIPRKDSRKFHKLINKSITKRDLLEKAHKTSFLLKKEDLAHFKNALNFLDIDCKSRGEAYIAHLWTIALKVTKGRMYEAIKRIWKIRCGIHQMTEAQSIQFHEFYSLL